jgi:hypothetical protein
LSWNLNHEAPATPAPQELCGSAVSAWLNKYNNLSCRALEVFDPSFNRKYWLMSILTLLFQTAAFFKFFAAAAGAWIIPADFRFLAAKRQIHDSAIDKCPCSSLLAEGRDLVVLDSLVFLGIRRNKFDSSLSILFFPAGYIENLKSMPLGFFSPFAGILPIEISQGTGMDGSLNKADVRCDMRGISRAHQSLARWSASYAVNIGFTAFAE